MKDQPPFKRYSNLLEGICVSLIVVLRFPNLYFYFRNKSCKKELWSKLISAVQTASIEQQL